jgi:arsenate reductase
MTYTVSASTRAGGAASIHARTSDIAFDGSAQSGDALPGPADLLCAALSACVLKNVERFSHMLPFRYESASIEVTAEREEPPPRIVRLHYRLRVVTDEPPRPRRAAAQEHPQIRDDHEHARGGVRADRRDRGGLVGRRDVTADVKVLFVCVHNAARSRMAEALLRELGGPRFEVTSAGFEPREVNPLVVEALAQVGLSLPSTAPQPSVFDLFKAGRHFHYVIGVCDEEHGQKCPLFPGVTQRLYWSFPDPASFEGAHSEKLARVAQVREAIRSRLEAWLSPLPGAATSATKGTDLP